MLRSIDAELDRIHPCAEHVSRQNYRHQAGCGVEWRSCHNLYNRPDRCSDLRGHGDQDQGLSKEGSFCVLRVPNLFGRLQQLEPLRIPG